MADVLAIRDDYRLQTWAQAVQACRNSEMTNRERQISRRYSTKA